MLEKIFVAKVGVDRLLHPDHLWYIVHWRVGSWSTLVQHHQ